MFDVAIIGAGPTGAALALLVAKTGLSVALVDARDPSIAPPPDGRNFAIVTGSWHLLNSIGITEKLLESSQPLHGLEAVDGGRHLFGQPSILFSDSDLDAPDPDETMGHMVMAAPLQAALDEAIRDHASIDVFAPERFAGLTHHADRVEIALDSGKTLSASLIVGADGMNSPVRQALGIGVEGRNYNKSVLTANVRLSTPHHGIARQLFTPEGPFATLPLTGQRANLAWYMKRGAAEALAERPVAEVEAELNARFSNFAGDMRIDGKVGSYPLVLQIAEKITGPRAALVGDAARRVNPLAGQGLNQGFRDIAVLNQHLSDALYTGSDLGSDIVLGAYSADRHLDGTLSALALDGIDRLFSNDSALTKPLRTLGILAAGRVSPLRRWLAQKASANESGVPPSMQG